jgi:hypothetical protein
VRTPPSGGAHHPFDQDERQRSPKVTQDVAALPVREQLVHLLAVVNAQADLLDAMRDRLADAQIERSCPRCQEPPPPLPRWPGDPHARDERPPHRCGRPASKR